MINYVGGGAVVCCRTRDVVLPGTQSSARSGEQSKMGEVPRRSTGEMPVSANQSLLDFSVAYPTPLVFEEAIR